MPPRRLPITVPTPAKPVTVPTPAKPVTVPTPAKPVTVTAVTVILVAVLAGCGSGGGSSPGGAEAAPARTASGPGGPDTGGATGSGADTSQGSSASDAGNAARPRPTPTATQSAPPTFHAAQRYLLIVAPYHRARTRRADLERAYAGKSAGTTVSQTYRSAASAEQAALRRYLTDLVAAPWPAALQPTARRAAQESRPLVGTLGALARARTGQEIRDAWRSDTSSTTSTAALRVGLGFPGGAGAPLSAGSLRP